MRSGRRTTLEGAIVLLLVCLPWLEGGATPLGLFLSHTLIFTLLAVAVASGVREGRIVVMAGWEGIAGLAFAAVCLASFIRVDYRFGSFLSLWDVFMTLLLALAMILIGPGSFRVRAGALAASAAAQALLVPALPAQANLTPSGTFANANQLAAYLNVGTFVAAGLAVDRVRGGRRAAAVPWIAVCLACVAAMLAVGARGALLSMILAPALWVVASARDLSRRSRRAIAAALAAFAILAALAVAARFERIEDPYRFDRVKIWAAGARAALDHPLLGMGPGMFERRGYRYAFPLDTEVYRYSKVAGSTHSTWLQALAETGLAGGLALVWLVVATIGPLRRMRLDDEAAGACGVGGALALTACLIHGFVDMPFHVPAVTLSLVVLMVPLLSPRRIQDAPLAVELSTRPGPRRRDAALALAGAGLTLYLGGVLLPLLADASYAAGAGVSRPGIPGAGVGRAIAINPYNPAYYAGRAEMRWDRRRPLDPPTFAAVRLDLEEARRLDPGRPELTLRLARLQARACFDLSSVPACLDDAERIYREALALGISDPRPRLDLAVFLMARGAAPDEPIALMREALELEPNYLGARQVLARALADAGRREEAERERARLEERRRALASYEPKNDYERDLMRMDEAKVEAPAGAGMAAR